RISSRRFPQSASSQPKTITRRGVPASLSMRPESRAMVCRVAICLNSVVLVETLLDPLQCCSFESSPHDAQSVADACAKLTVEAAIRHCTDSLSERLSDLV